MSHTIHKYRLHITDRQVITMPAGARILHVGEQYGRLHVWAEVYRSRHEEERTFVIVGTGNPIPKENLKHLGSVVMPNPQGGTQYVWHVYEVR